MLAEAALHLVRAPKSLRLAHDPAQAVSRNQGSKSIPEGPLTHAAVADRRSPEAVELVATPAALTAPGPDSLVHELKLEPCPRSNNDRKPWHTSGPAIRLNGLQGVRGAD